MDILSPLPKISEENQSVLVMKDRYSKFERAVPKSSTTALQIPSLFINNCLIPYGIPDVCSQIAVPSKLVSSLSRYVPFW